MALLSFDIEISDVFDLRAGEDINKYAPFHIAVAATAVDQGEERLWYSVGPANKPLTNMTKDTAREMLEYLLEMQGLGHMVCAWNGLSFDLRWIGHVAEDMTLAAQIAMKSYDPMFQFFNQKGFPVGLEPVAMGMGIRRRKLMSSDQAPKRWCAGDHQAVMDYVLNDCRLTNDVVKSIVRRKKVVWVTAKGDLKSEPMPRLKTVETVLKEPEPDQSWMSAPIPRRRFHEWFPG